MQNTQTNTLAAFHFTASAIYVQIYCRAPIKAVLVAQWLPQRDVACTPAWLAFIYATAAADAAGASASLLCGSAPVWAQASCSSICASPVAWRRSANFARCLSLMHRGNCRAN
jgi:hypothetical protein